MIEEPVSKIYTTNPPQWDQWWWCGCGHREFEGRKIGKTLQENMMESWKARNGL
jgi:hypothetical protein